MVGIYKFTNLINNKIYIGQSTKVESRIKEHFKNAYQATTTEYNTPLHQAIRKYGKENFKVEIIEECPNELLNEREIYWIDYYHSYIGENKLGYNLTRGGQLGFFKLESFSKIDLIVDYLKNSNLIQREIAALVGITEEMVQGINTGRYWHNSKNDYPIRKGGPGSHTNKQKLPQKPIKILCPECKENFMWNYSCTCKRCLGKRNRIPLPSREDLIQTLKKYKTLQQVAAEYNISTMLLDKWMDEMKIPRKRKEYMKL